MKLPVVTIKTDDFEVEIDGVKYAPHAGETVSFKRRLSPLSMSRLMRALSASTSSEAEIVDFILNDTCEVISDAIAEWTWTDPYTGELLGEPTPEKIASLDIDEVMYLVGKLFEIGNQRGNPQREPSEVS